MKKVTLEGVRRAAGVAVEALEGRTLLAAGLLGEYFNNPTLTGSPAGTRVDFVTRESKDNLLFECRDKSQPAAWVHRNYVTK